MIYSPFKRRAVHTLMLQVYLPHSAWDVGDQLIFAVLLVSPGRMKDDLNRIFA